MNITISIPQQTFINLSEVSNKSGLITQLLNEYFDRQSTPEILRLKRDALRRRFVDEIKQFDYEIKVKEKKKQSEEEALKEAEEAKKRIDERVKRRIKEMIKIKEAREKEKKRKEKEKNAKNKLQILQ